MTESIFIAVCVALVAVCICWLWTWYDLRDQRIISNELRKHEKDSRAKLGQVIESADATIGRLQEQLQEAQSQVEPLHAENRRLDWEYEETRKLHNQALSDVQKMEQQIQSLRDSLVEEKHKFSIEQLAVQKLQDEICDLREGACKLAGLAGELCKV